MFKPPDPKMPPPPPTMPDLSKGLLEGQAKKNALGGTLGNTFLTGGQAWAPKTTGSKTLLGM
jgi:hypothetical protein